MNTKYRIFDWAGNDKSSHYGTFETFEDAWAAIYEAHDHLDGAEFDEAVGEFYVDACEVRATNYLDPRDPRNGTVKK